MNKRRCQYGKYYIDYSLKQADRKTLKLTVHPSSDIVVTAPREATPLEIDAFIKRKWLWLHKQLRYFGRFQRKLYVKEYVSGESYLYLGRQYKLQVKKDELNQVKLLKGKMVLTTTKDVRDSSHNKKILNQWFRQRADTVFHERLSLVYENFSKVEQPSLRVQKMNKRWGSYVTNEKIILNPLLIHASKDCIDYVITHEFCHFTYKRHDKRFYNLLNKRCPDWEAVKEKLEFRYS